MFQQRVQFIYDLTCKQIARFSCVLKLLIAVIELQGFTRVVNGSRRVQDAQDG